MAPGKGTRSGQTSRPSRTPEASREEAAAGKGEASDCCPFQEAIDLLSRRHAMTILWLLQKQEPRRFNEIKRALEINPVTLTQRLNEMEQAGMLERQVYNESPPRVEYRLTRKGRDLVPLMDQLSDWADKYAMASA